MSIHTQASLLGIKGSREVTLVCAGASRYQSGGASGPAAPASSYMDPYTGASRYTGAPAAAAAAPASSYMDPYTGASRYSGASQPAAPAKPAGVLPVVSPQHLWIFS